jgi:hypothetical protein
MNKNILIVGEYGKIFLDPLSAVLGDQWAIQHWTIEQPKAELYDLASQASILVVTAELTYSKDKQLIQQRKRSNYRIKLARLVI